MTLRKKIVMTTIAASVAASAFAGIPLSTKGLAEKVGFVQVANAAEFADQDFQERINDIVDALTDAGTLSDVTEAQDLLDGKFGTVNLTNIARIQPVLDQFGAALDPGDDSVLYSLFAALVALPYETDTSGEHLEDIRTDTTYRAMLERIADGADIDELVVDDFISFLYAVEEGMVDEFGDLSLTQLIDLFEDSEARNARLTEVLDAVLSDMDYVVSQALDHYDITSAVLKEVVNNFLVDLNNTEKLKIISAVAALTEAHISLEEDDSPSPGPGVITPPPPPPAQTANEAANELEDLGDEIANAPEGEKEALIAEAVDKAREAIAQISKVTVTGVVVVDGKSAVTVNAAQVAQQIANIKTVLDALKAAAPGAEARVKANLTLDLGATSTDEVEATIGGDLLAAAEEAGLSGVEIVADGLSATLPVDAFEGDVTFSASKSTATADITQNKPAASDVYDFTITSNGDEVIQFTKPIELQIPVSDTSDYDTDLLTLAKIINDRLEYYGGIFDPGTGTFNGQRSSFSSYVVVENKVEFGDTASVDAWAGRQIEVLAAKGAINGKAEGVFAPRDQVTRAEFAKMLIHALSLQNELATESFDDVDADDWFAGYVAAAVESGIINGRSATTFDPHANITRAEMATMVTRALQATLGLPDVTDVDAALAAFADGDEVSPTLEAGVAFAASHGLVIGSAGNFDPNDNANRAQAAVIIYRAFNYTE